MMNPPSLSTPAKILFPFMFVFQFVATFIGAFQADPSGLLNTLGSLAFFWLIAWWFEEDSKRRGVIWPMDIGMFIYYGWIVLLPFHLFRTRGARALIGILGLVGVAVAGWLTAAITIAIFWYDSFRPQ
jgi:hypothetical protein